MSVPSVPGTVPGTVVSVCVRPYVVGRGTLTDTLTVTQWVQARSVVDLESQDVRSPAPLARQAAPGKCSPCPASRGNSPP